MVKGLLTTSRVLSVGEMATMIAHELNQPIGSIANILREPLRYSPPDFLESDIASIVGQETGMVLVASTQFSMKDHLIEGEVLITDDPQADTTGYDRVLYFKPPFGPYPRELAETYPFNAEVPEQADSAAKEQADRNMRALMAANPEARFSIRIK